MGADVKAEEVCRWIDHIGIDDNAPRAFDHVYTLDINRKNRVSDNMTYEIQARHMSDYRCTCSKLVDTRRELPSPSALTGTSRPGTCATR